ncbi:MAG: hypothetical protein HWE07_11975 [Cytophagia bacterium]|nr:hypothetical protein [Cytophagia bacterium]
MKIKYTFLIFLYYLLGCSNQKVSEEKLKELEFQLKEKNKQVTQLKNQIRQQQNSQETEIWYAFEPTTEYNIIRLGSGESKVIDTIELVDSVDVNYNFEHETTISQLKDNRTASILANFIEFEETLHRSNGYGPEISQTSYNVKTLILCEEEGLPIETENCTNNVYILVEPTELGYENNLFIVSRLFRAVVKSQTDSNDGIILTIEHSRFPRKELKILIRPELVKFIE